MKKTSKCQQLKLNVKKGLTLIEILVAMSLSLLLIGSLYGVYITSYKSYKRSIAKAELNQNARIALERISRDLRQAERIITPLPPDDTDDMNPAPDEIQFQDGHDTSSIQYIKYVLSSNELERQIIHYYFSNPDDPNSWVEWDSQDEYGNLPDESVVGTVRADKIESIKFFGDKLITIKLVASDGNDSYTYQTQVLGRNIQ